MKTGDRPSQNDEWYDHKYGPALVDRADGRKCAVYMWTGRTYCGEQTPSGLLLNWATAEEADCFGCREMLQLDAGEWSRKALDVQKGATKQQVERILAEGYGKNWRSSEMLVRCGGVPTWVVTNVTVTSKDGTDSVKVDLHPLPGAVHFNEVA